MTVGQDIYQPREPRPVTSDIESVRRFFEKLTAKGAFVAVSSSQQATTRPGGPLREMRSDQSLGEFSGFIEADGDLEPIERSFVANAVHSRRKEFALGRALARRALAAAGHARVGIPAGPDRAPIWPTGIIGSITHCDHIAVAAVAPTQSGIQAIGIDLERTAGTADLIDVVTTVRERMRPDFADFDMDTLVGLHFSAKESAFKALYPRLSRFLDFQDIVLEFDFANASFTADLADNIPSGRTLCKKLRGHFYQNDGFAMTYTYSI